MLDTRLSDMTLWLYMRKSLLVVWWFPVALILVIINLSLLNHTVSTVEAEPEDIVQAAPAQHFAQVAADKEGTSQVLGTSVVAEDARPFLIEAFLDRHDSPMTPFASHIVTEADRFGIDFRLITAIAMCESNVGKRMPKNSYNAWGIAVYTGQNSGAAFTNWEEAITWVSRYMKERYYDNGLIDLKDIGAVYAPPSVEKEYSWTRCVEKFQNSIQ